MTDRNDNATPSQDDLYSDQFVEVMPEPDFTDAAWVAEMDSAFGYCADELSEAELDALYAAEMEARNEPPARFAPFDSERVELPVLRPIRTPIRRINLAAFGKAVTL